MALDNILQSDILTKFAYPFLLIFFIVFAILEKTKLFGEDKKQTNALIAFVIGLIFVGFAYPKEVVSNMIQFLTVAIIVLFVVLLLWGFIFSDIKEGFKPEKWMKYLLGIIAGIAVVIAVVWATGSNSKIWDWMFDQSWSGDFWTNFVFIVVVAGALGLILKGSGGGKK